MHLSVSSDARRGNAATRTSNRVRASGPSARILDEETRRIIQKARIEALESDNFGETNSTLALGEDDLFIEDTIDLYTRAKNFSNAFDSKAALHKLREARATIKKLPDILAEDVGMTSDILARGLVNDQEQPLVEAVELDAENPIESVKLEYNYPLELAAGNVFDGKGSIEALHYFAATAGVSESQPLPFCSVCPNAAKYNCMFCGGRYCSLSCKGSHEETQCQRR